ncbi:MAG TPA: LysR family transcriptional regulator [Bacteriovoracaceae bacterium]|nr:LysR family transcriptional regulator [Bacteriovoracaceae bacterium]
MTPFKREYEYFLLLCKNLNVSVAASEAGIQQAGLSKALKALEEQLKKPLFHRTNRGLLLTTYGEIFRDVLLSTSVQWENSLEEELAKLSEVTGTYKIGAHPVVAVNLLSKFFPGLNEENEGLKLKLELKRSAEVTRDVIDFKLDFGLVANPVRHPDLIIVRLQKEYIACWGSTSKAPRKVLYYNPEMIEMVRTLKRFDKYKLIEVQDYEVIASLTQKSEGVCILPSPVAERYRNLKQFGKTLLEVDVCLIYRHDSLKTKAFSEIIKKIKLGFEL